MSNGVLHPDIGTFLHKPLREALREICDVFGD